MRRSLAKATFIFAGSVLLFGCARPVVTPKLPGFQHKADATRDWQIVARQIAQDMVQRGLLHDPANFRVAVTPTESQPYYISVAIPSSKFLHEVRQSLQGEILSRGGTVVSLPDGATEIRLDADLTYWPSAYRRQDGAPSTEVAWEASITKYNQVNFDVRYPMYVNELDASLYRPVGPQPVRLSYTP